MWPCTFIICSVRCDLWLMDGTPLTGNGSEGVGELALLLFIRTALAPLMSNIQAVVMAQKRQMLTKLFAEVERAVVPLKKNNCEPDFVGSDLALKD